MSDDDQQRRKRIRKGTTSCWECKRRKIRCERNPVDAAVCAGCLSRGTTCKSQEEPPEQTQGSAPNIGERLGRIENLLQTLLERFPNDGSAIALRQALESDQRRTAVDSPESSDVWEDAPLLSLFETSALRRVPARESSEKAGSAPWCTPKSLTSLNYFPPKIEALRKKLAALLPSQHDADLIQEHSNAWAISRCLSGIDLTQYSCLDDMPAFNVKYTAEQHPIIIGRVLLIFTVSMLQLPFEFDTRRLDCGPDLEKLMTRNLSIVSTLVTHDDEMVGTLEGAECLFLQGVFYKVSGNLKRAWLIFRHGLNVLQLMGYDKNPGPLADQPPEVLRGRYMWNMMMLADRYLGVILGLPAAAPDDTIHIQEEAHPAIYDRDIVFSQKMCLIAGAIISRNRARSTESFATTQDIDIKLEELASSVPKAWWQIPDVHSLTKSMGTVIALERVMFQIFYHQLTILVHLPFLLRVKEERYFEYSKLRCLESARSLIHRYRALRERPELGFCSEIADFAAFTGALVLLLTMVEPGLRTRETEEIEADKALIMNVYKIMEGLAQSGRDMVAKQSVKVLKTLLATQEKDHPREKNLRLEIPYLGTITIFNHRAAPETDQAQTKPCPTPSVINTTPTNSTPYTPPCPGEAIPYCMPSISFVSHQDPLTAMQQQQQPTDCCWEAPLGGQFLFTDPYNTDMNSNWVFQDFP